jgi:hypothetical protein
MRRRINQELMDIIFEEGNERGDISISNCTEVSAELRFFSAKWSVRSRRFLEQRDILRNLKILDVHKAVPD